MSHAVPYSSMGCRKRLEKKYKVNVGRMFRIRKVKSFWFSRSGTANYSEDLITKKSIEVFGENLVTMIIDETNSRVAAYVEPYGKIWMSKHFLLKEYSIDGYSAPSSNTDIVREISSDAADLYEKLMRANDTENAQLAKNIIDKTVFLSENLTKNDKKEKQQTT